MLLAQLCGLPVDTDIRVIDEAADNATPKEEIATEYNMQEVYRARHDVHALEMLTKVTDEQKNVALSAMLPNLALVGTYSFSNPNMFDGFKTRFSGAFSVGVMLKIPVWHWGGNYNKLRQARAEQHIAQLTLDDAKEKIALQVSQAAFKAQEAMKTYLMTMTNETKAQENLSNAQIGFQEGVLTTDNVLEAQTAWLKANSEKIDAMIDVQLCDTYLTKVLGRSIY
ncbi:MAG: TolC family protein [Muribaculaceae bacterium]|nr:TolC family protein [Muribaculaceae bacterium]